ncbi:MAG: acylphosphatase [Steroidobacteraceae bacterium]
MIARRCIVSGRVQGVFYRKSTQSRARELGVAGHARNLDDGRVEVLAVGEAVAVEALLAWLWEGPSAARVVGVEVQELEVATLQPPAGFSTG